MCKAVQQTQRGTHEAEEKPGSQDVRRAKRRSTHRTRNRDFPVSFSGRRPIVLPRLFRQSSLVKMTSPVRLDPAERLILLRRPDRFRKWQSLDDRQLSEVLAHHRHVLDSYQLGIMRRLDAALATPTRKRRSKG
jgi:hypothetical protein